MPKKLPQLQPYLKKSTETFDLSAASAGLEEKHIKKQRYILHAALKSVF